MKPTKPGYYWVLQHYLNIATKQVDKTTTWEIVLVAYGRPHRAKTDVLMVSSYHWRERLDKAPDYWEWSGPIQPPISVQQ